LVSRGFDLAANLLVMKSVFWLIPGRLAGRAGPLCEAWCLSEIRAAGFHAVLNLSEFEPDRAEFAKAALARRRVGNR
jgi:hypothetical protein